MNQKSNENNESTNSNSETNDFNDSIALIEAQEQQSIAYKSRKSTRRKLFISAFLILAFCSVSFGQLIVHDPKHMAQNVIEFTKTITELQQHQAYRVLMDGAWRSPLKIVQTTDTLLATLGVDTKKLGWLNDAYAGEKAVKGASQGIDQINKVLHGDVKAGSEMSQIIQDVYGDIPVTRRGAQVRMAYESVTGTMAHAGDTQTAIKEILKNSDDIKARYEKGGLVTQDRERIRGMEQDLQLRVQALNAQAVAQNNLLLAQGIAMQAGKEAREERLRLDERQKMLRAMSNVNFGLADNPNKGEE